MTGIAANSGKVGQLVGPWDVEQAVLTTLKLWLEPYLGEIELDRGLELNTLRRPPTPESYRGSIDGTPWQQDETPTLIVVVKPYGQPDRSASAGYGQMYDATVHAIVVEETEDEARRLAGLYGAAIQGALLQQGDLQDFAEETRLFEAPTVDFIDPDSRTAVMCTSAYHVFVNPIVNDQLGLAQQVPVEPPFGEWPEVDTTSVTVEGEPLTRTFTADLALGSNVLTNVSPFPHGVANGTAVIGNGLPVGTYVIASVPQRSTLSVSYQATISGQGLTVHLSN